MTEGTRASSAGWERTTVGRSMRVTALVAAAGLLTAVGPIGAQAAHAEPVSTDSRSAVSRAVPQEVAPRVTFVQKVAPQVTLSRPGDGRISAKGTDLVAISESGGYDVPDTAMRAYRSAAREMATIRPECQIPWTLLAGIGRVESDHGRYGGSVLGVDGLPRPAIRGVALNGVGPVAAIADSDDGRWDDDDVWDRAVGPMQFIPTTWESAGRDGDDDGVANPNDIDDAALAAADYLCPSSGSILSDAALDAAILSYNHSDYYVALVRAFMVGYETGVFDLPSPPPVETETEQDKKKNKKKKDADKDAKKDADSARGTSDGDRQEPRTSPRPQPDPDPAPKPSRPRPRPTTSPTATPTATATATATPTPTPTATQ